MGFLNYPSNHIPHYFPALSRLNSAAGFIFLLYHPQVPNVRGWNCPSGFWIL